MDEKELPKAPRVILMGEQHDMDRQALIEVLPELKKMGFTDFFFEYPRDLLIPFNKYFQEGKSIGFISRRLLSMQFSRSTIKKLRGIHKIHRPMIEMFFKAKEIGMNIHFMDLDTESMKDFVKLNLRLHKKIPCSHAQFQTAANITMGMIPRNLNMGYFIEKNAPLSKGKTLALAGTRHILSYDRNMKGHELSLPSTLNYLGISNEDIGDISQMKGEYILEHVRRKLDPWYTPSIPVKNETALRKFAADKHHDAAQSCPKELRVWEVKR